MKKIILASVAAGWTVGCGNIPAVDDGGNSGGEGGEGGTIAQIGSLAISEISDLKLAQSVSPEIPDAVLGKGTPSLRMSDSQKSMEGCMVKSMVSSAKQNLDMMAMDLCMVEAIKGIKPGRKYKFELDFAAILPDMDFDTETDFETDIDGIPEVSGIPDMSEFDPSEMDQEDFDPSQFGLKLSGASAAASGPPSSQTISVYLDTSVDKQLTLYMCDAGKLQTKLVLRDAGEQGSRGSYKYVMDDADTKVQMEGAFDNGVGAVGRTRISTAMSFDMDMNETSMKFFNSVALDLSKDGVSVVRAASESSSDFSDTSISDKELVAALIDPSYGAALFQRSMTGDFADLIESSPELALLSNDVFTSRSYFNAAQEMVESDATVEFAEGGKLHVSESMLPKLLGSDFSVTFDESDWDCSDTEEIEFDIDEEKVAACFENYMPSVDDILAEMSCFDLSMGAAIDFEFEGDDAFATGEQDFEDDAAFDDLFGTVIE